jgi:glycerate 2-kinase
VCVTLDTKFEIKVGFMTAPDPTQQPREFLTYLFQTAVKRALPLHNTADYLPSPPKNGGRTIVLGAGKAGAAMAQAVEAHWPVDVPLSGLVVNFDAQV